MVNQNTQKAEKYIIDEISTKKLIIKVLSILILFAIISPFIKSYGKISLYNLAFPGRLRFPFGENSSLSYNLTLNNLDAMFASHIISGSQKEDDEFRVVVIGDSSIWGILLQPDQTLPAMINSELHECNGKKVKVFNIGYPTLSLTKDLMIMAYGMRYKPDLIIWPLTLESFPHDKQLTNPLIENNMKLLRFENEKYNLDLDLGDKLSTLEQYYQNTIIFKRKEMADVIRLQFLGMMWSATGIDQYYPADYQKAQTDLENSLEFHGYSTQDDLDNDLNFNLLGSMMKIAGNIPIVFINEPILISDGLNHEIRYNFYYPIWAYDHYRTQLSTYMIKNKLAYIDLWDVVPNDEYTNSAIHLTSEGEVIFSNKVVEYLNKTVCYGN